MLRSTVRCLVVPLLLAVAAPAVAAEPVPVFGPRTYQRDAGRPAAEVHRFSVRNPHAAYTLHLDIGGADGAPVASAVVRVNGAVVLGPRDFNPRVSTLSAPVDLAADNEVSVELRGRPGGVATLRVERAPVTAEVGPAGGTLTDPGGEWELVVPPGALDADHTLTVTQGVAPPGEVPEDLALVGDVWQLEPAGLVFAEPLRWRVRYLQEGLPEGGIRERTLGLLYLLEDGSAHGIDAVFDHAANEAVASLPHFSFVGFLRPWIERVGDGTITNPVLVERIADLVAEALADPPDGQTVEEYVAANADLLEPFLEAVEEVLGPEFVAATFPPEVCQLHGCAAVAGCGDRRGLEAGAPWPMLGACPTHLGRGPHLGAQSPTLKWQTEVGLPPSSVKVPRIASQPALAADGTVYVGAAHWLAAVDPAGPVRWDRPASGGIFKGVLSSPVVRADGSLVAGSQGGHLHAIAPDGAELWRLAAGGPVPSSPVVAPDGTIYVGSAGKPGGLLAVAPDGALLWRFAAGPVTSSPALAADGTVVVASEDGWLYALEPDGTQRWAAAVGPVSFASPAVAADGAVVVGALDGGLTAMEPDGTPRWRYEADVAIFTTPAFGQDGTLYVGSADGVLHAVGPDGVAVWTLDLDGRSAPAAAVGADGTVYAAAAPGLKCKKSKTGGVLSCGGLAALAPDGGVRWTAPLPPSDVVSPPALGDDGTVYVNAGGVLVAVGGDARGGEICSNGLDDDGDGAADCADTDCAGLVCDDGDACTTVDTCSAGVCTAGPPLVCDDGNDCTLEACDPLFGCASTPVTDGVACTDDGNLCTDDLCLSGSCTHPSVPDDCGGRECGFSPSGCADCGACDPGFRCTALGSCVLDLPAGLALVSAAPTGRAGDAQSRWPAISDDGRVVAFVSTASDLVPGDGNGVADIFLHDRTAGATVRVSVASDGGEADGESAVPTALADWLSAEGRFVAFHSRATNLVPGDDNFSMDVFVHDHSTQTTERVSVGASGAQGNGHGVAASISADGRLVAFVSTATNLVAGDTNASHDVFVRDRLLEHTARVSVDSAGRQGDGFSVRPSLSADGRFVVFDSDATNLVADDSNGFDDVFVHQRSSGHTARVSISSTGLQGTGFSRLPSLSSDGRFVVFLSFAPNLVPGDTNGLTDAFVHDRWTGATSLVSVAEDGTPADGSSGPALRVSGDGRFVAFISRASNLASGATAGTPELFVHDRLSGETVRPVPAADSVDSVDLSRDGRVLAFATPRDLVPEDDNGAADVYVVPNPLAGPAEGNCRDGLDDDSDGLVDCADLDCGDHPACLGLEALCGDGVDDDGDGLADCADPDCAGRTCAADRLCEAGACVVPGCGDVSGLQAGAPWPMRGACPSHQGRGPAAGPAAPQLLWTFPADVSVDISSPAVAADGTLYLPSRDGFLYAVAPDGSERWRFAAADQMLSTPAVAADGTVYAGSEDGHLYALRPDGSERWRFATGGAVVSSPAIAADGSVYFGSGDDHLYAVGPDGAELWRFATGDDVASSPALAPDGTVYVGSFDGHLYAVGADGTERWRHPTGLLVSSPAVGRDGAVYVGSFDGRVYALNPDGTERWTARDHSTLVVSSPALGADGAVYVGGDDGSLWAIDPGGTVRWTFATGREVKPTPAVGADGTVYATSFDGALYALHPDGSEAWRFQTGGFLLSSPALGGDGTVYFGTDEGLVYAVGAASP